MIRLFTSNLNFVRFCLFVCWRAAHLEVRLKAQNGPQPTPAQTRKHQNYELKAYLWKKLVPECSETQVKYLMKISRKRPSWLILIDPQQTSPRSKSAPPIELIWCD